MIIMFVVPFHQNSIPRLYGEWAFPVQVVLWVYASVLSFTFYAASWMPAGRVVEDDKVGKEGPECWTRCQECKLPVPLIARHCPRCKMCVWEHDHHCPVVSNCLGRDNIQVFRLLYILASASGFLYLVVVMGWAWWHHIELLPWEWVQGFQSIVFLVGNWIFYNNVKKRRRRLKEKYPMFFRKKSADD